jgi:hypothetical protein
MTSVNITTTRNTVTVSTSGVTNTIEVATQGPQGPAGDAGSNFTLADSAKVDKSIIYYDSDAGSYKADSTWTTDTLTDGGNF